MASTTPLETSLTEPRKRLWTRDEYHRAGELGLFGPDEKLELIEGEIIQKVSPRNLPHTSAVRRTARALERAFGADHEVRYQMPLIVADISEPEPDVLVLSGPPDDYDDHQPATEEALLVVEVSESTLAFDRRTKSRIYARASIAEYWIVNLIDRGLEVHREPQPDGVYGKVAVYQETDSLSPLAAPGASVSVSDLLPIKKES